MQVYVVFNAYSLVSSSAASAPTEVMQVAMDINSVTVQWSLPEFMRGILLGWYLRWTSAIGQDLGEQNITDPETRVHLIGDLEPSEVYNVYVMVRQRAHKPFSILHLAITQRVRKKFLHVGQSIGR